ncbi:hypothetical protein ABNF65_11975 [Paenibacillus larvae]
MAMGLQGCEAGLPALKRTGVHILSVLKVPSKGRNYSEIGKTGYTCQFRGGGFPNSGKYPLSFFSPSEGGEGFQTGGGWFFYTS